MVKSKEVTVLAALFKAELEKSTSLRAENKALREALEEIKRQLDPAMKSARIAKTALDKGE